MILLDFFLRNNGFEGESRDSGRILRGDRDGGIETTVFCSIPGSHSVGSETRGDQLCVVNSNRAKNEVQELPDEKTTCDMQ